jgi:hypothetical protein
VDFTVASTSDQGVKFPPDEGVATRPPLQLDKALDRPAGILVFRVEEGRAVVSLDHREGPAIFQEGTQVFQRPPWIGKMFKDKTDKDVIKLFLSEGEVKDIPLPERHIGEPFLPDLLFRPFQGVCGNIDGGYLGPGTVPGKNNRLGSDPAAGLKDF